MKHKITDTKGRFPYGSHTCFCGYSDSEAKVTLHISRKERE